MKRLFFGLTFVILAGLVFSSLARQTQAAGFRCDDPNAKWNKDYTSFLNSPYSNLASWKGLQPLFKCMPNSSYNKAFYTRIVDQTQDTQGEASLHCEGGADFENSCIIGKERCIREADCEAGIEGGVCIKDIEPGGPKQSDVDCATGITKNYYSFINSIKKVTYKNSRWRIIRFRCPDLNKTTCWVQVKDTVPPPIKETETSAITISDCCRQIVPDIGDPAKNDYSLNHLVQVAINIYECILCIVGSLILIMLITGAFFLLTSAGNDSMVGKGKQIISAAIIGGIIVFFSYLIINFTVRALGANFKAGVDDNRIEIKPQGPSS